MVSVDSSRGAAAQGAAVLPPLRRERRNRVRRVCVGAEPSARHVRRADPTPASARGVRLRRQELPPPRRAIQLIAAMLMAPAAPPANSLKLGSFTPSETTPP